ncbi:hypothetical protein LAZ67_10002836 [Cordylochernes scorpioides]|uniref:ATP-dependent DNA helicase n=1 Tax=Cordylochernes scorpioides TaxID=51811 RepID=A0ABY6KYM6_9ARAC|nr:hypothetical protein LAZ67_10002836 [Cordylochernes scorpioides]
MPTRTYIAKSEKKASGFKAAKDRVSLLLCSNASGDRMLKPLLVNRSLKPRALKGKDLNTLPVHWMANKKAWVTTAIFTEWFNKCFVPEVENYMKEMGLEFKILLILDNAPGNRWEGFDDFGEHDIEELLVDEALNDDDILESMVDTTKDFETVDSELEDVTPLDEKLLREGLQLSGKLEIFFIQNDNEVERALKFQRDLKFCMSGYRELYKELVKPSQRLITDYLVKEKKITEVPKEALPCRSDDVILSSSDESDLAPIHKRAIEAKQRRIEQQRQRRLNSPVRERHNEQQRQYRMNMSENQRALQRENSRLRMQRIRQGDNLPLPTGTCFEEDQIPLHLCGQLDQVCPKCRAKYFELEQTTYSKTFHKCCSKGKVELEPIQTSELLESLMTGKHQLSKNFMENIRSVNSALAFASMGANLAPPPGYGPYCFRINGQIYHHSATMAPKDALRCINNLLKKIMQNEKTLGGKTIVFGGDFRQTLPVVPHGTQAAIVDSSIKFHPLWKIINILKLDNNIRSIDPEFSAWLLKLGNGELTNDLVLDSDTFEIPSEMYTDKAILCPRNVDVDDINNRVLDILEGDSITYFSSDSIDDATPEDNESYPPVFLNSLNTSGMPLHKLKL